MEDQKKPVSAQAFQPVLIRGAAPEKQEGFSRYPFPEVEWRSWWDQCHPLVKKDWAPLLRAMTPENRVEFHAARKARSFPFPDTSPAGRAARDEAERFLLTHWRQRLGVEAA